VSLPSQYRLTDPWLLQPLPAYGSLTAADYAALGFRCGLEIHQQLLTARKLFCRCPAGRYHQGKHDAEILRHMRPTLSEMGEYDGTALMEFKTRKEIVYLLDRETVCTYEMDDAPPFEMDDEALDGSLLMAMLLKCSVVSEVHITRKQYLDGSIPTGFQRTAIVGTDGRIPFGERTVRIRQISLEEDSCREVSDRGHRRVYRTDRLGMPLIETVTDPDMRTPDEAMAVGQILRRLARAGGMVRTGAGAARQDVNVSVEGGTRIEIKGVCSLREVGRLTHNEALRQRSLLGIRGELERRGVTAESIADRLVDVTPQVRGTACGYIAQAVAQGAVVGACPLPGFQGLLEVPTQPRTSFLKEFSDRVRVIACLDTLPNLVVSTQNAPSLSSTEWGRVSKACGVDGDVPVIVVWGSRADVETAAREIALRARDAARGVPNETRQALDDGTNGFERILPGADRMYPDTDLPPIGLADSRLEAIAARLPLRPWERLVKARELGIGEDLAVRLSRHRSWELFAHLVERLPAGSRFTAAQLASLLLDRSYPRPASLAAAGSWWEETVAALADGRVIPEAVWTGEGEVAARLDDRTARQRFEEALAAARPAAGREWPSEPARRRHALMGAVMPALRGRVPGRQVGQWLDETPGEARS
jgi:glutamyl-tRNA(Gln) amidotransferase subunit E